MHIIIGLGNPGREYHRTRHNVGFDVIDVLSEKLGIDPSSELMAFYQQLLESESL